jgi:hypothetical protein
MTKKGTTTTTKKSKPKTTKKGTSTNKEESTPEEDKETFTSKIYNKFLKRPAIGGSCIYIFVSSVGVIYSWVLFREFQINIFDFAETNDFLLIAFKEPHLFLVPLIIILLGLIIPFICKYSSGFSNYLSKRIIPNKSNSIFVTKLLISLAGVISTLIDSFIRYVTFSVSYMYIFGGIILMFFLPYYSAKNVIATRIKQKEPAVNLVYEKGKQKQSSTSVIEELNSVLIGSTEKFMFFYVRPEKNTEKGRTVIIPINKIISITINEKQQKKQKIGARPFDKH